MKKSNLILSLALLLSACGNSLDDSQKKDGRYYYEHREEAVKKMKWCLNEMDISVKDYLVYPQIFEEYQELHRKSKAKIDEYEYVGYFKKVKKSDEEIAKEKQEIEEAKEKLKKLEEKYSNLLQLSKISETEKLDGVNRANCRVVLGTDEFKAEFEKKYK
ncbi:MAG: hypothetical protein J1D99_03880 [Campylobacter sp.]|nr:hypothetical protein [Campylobacter sp.]